MLVRRTFFASAGPTMAICSAFMPQLAASRQVSVREHPRSEAIALAVIRPKEL